MSHELRTPLNAIIGYSEMLREEAEDLGHAEFAADLAEDSRPGKHLLGLINDVLDLSKIEAGKMDVFLEPFAIAELVQGVVSTIQPLAEKSGNAIVVNCPGDLGTMRSDQAKVRQALLNLLANATKFTRQGTITPRRRRASPARARRLGVLPRRRRRHRHDRRTDRQAVPAVHPGRLLDDPQVRRDRTRPDHHPPLLPDARRRRDRRQRARPGLDLHASASRPSSPAEPSSRPIRSPRPGPSDDRPQPRPRSGRPWSSRGSGDP